MAFKMTKEVQASLVSKSTQKSHLLISYRAVIPTQIVNGKRDDAVCLVIIVRG